MYTAENIDLRNHIKLNISILKYLLYWPPSYKSRFTNNLYKIYSIIMVSFIMVFFNVPGYVNVVLVSGDLERMISVSYLLLCNTMQVIKMVVLFRYGDEIRSLIDEMNDDIFKPKSEVDVEISKMHMKSFKIVSSTFMGISASTCLLFGLYPVIDNKGQRKIAFDYVYPYDVNQSPAYELTLIYQTVAVFALAITHVSIDSVFVGIMDFVGAQVEILADTLSKLEDVDLTGLKVGSAEVAKANLMNTNLKFCMHKHRRILIIVDKVNKYISIPQLAEFGLGSVILCVAMFQMSKRSPTSVEFMSNILYLIAMIVQILLYCWYGNEVIIKSSELPGAIFKCQWMDTDRQFKRNMLFFTMRTGKPIQMFAGHFFTLSLQSFGSIIRGGWSYFAVLRNMQNEE